MKKILLNLLIFIIFFLNIAAVVAIDAEKNAYMHNNIGVNHMREFDYFSAIKEFEIAIQLNPNTQATAVYYNNLGRVYLIIGYPQKAQTCFERAVIQNPLNFQYYLNLVSAFKCNGNMDAKLKEYKAKKDNPLNQIVVGLLYIKKGQLATGIMILDEFCNKEPNLVITKAVRSYMLNRTEDYRTTK